MHLSRPSNITTGSSQQLTLRSLLGLGAVGVALWTGLIAGLAYSMMVRLLYRQHFAAMHAYAEQQAALRMQPPTPAPQPPRQVGISVV